MIRHFRFAVLPLLAVSLLLAPGRPASAAQDATPEAECVTTTPEENKALAAMYWEEVVWGAQGKIAEVVAQDEVHHWGVFDTTTGFDAFAESMGRFLAAFPDLDFTVDHIAAEGDLVATGWTASGTQSGEWQGIPPTNEKVSWDGINIFRVECGKIAEAWGEANHLGLLAQLGSPDVPAFLADSAAEATPMADRAAATPCADDSPEANLALVERWTNELWVGQDLAVLDEIASPDIVHHGGAFPDAHGVDEIKEGVGQQLATFPDMQLTIDETIADGDLVAVRWSGTGTIESEFIGHPPTGEQVPLTGINIYQVNCGKIVESWSEINGLAILNAVLGEESAG